MPYHSIEDQKFWDEITPPRLSYLCVAGKQGGFDVAALPLGDPVGDNPPMILMLRFKPGGVLLRHAHHCYRVEVLISGTLTAPDGALLRPGAVMTSGPGEFYGPHTAGPEGAVTAEIFSAAYAKIEYDFAGQDAPSEMLEIMRGLSEQMEAAKATSEHS